MGVAKLRLFVAIELPAAVREHLCSVRDVLQSEASGIWWTREENLHLTIKFLGDTPEHLVKRLATGLATVRWEGPIRMYADGLEFFPPTGDIRIISAGVVGDVARLWQFQNAVEAICAGQGYPRDQRHYVPHITLTRAKEKVRSSIRSRAKKAASSLWPGPGFDVREFVLMQSTVQPGGPAYAPVDVFPLVP